MTTTEQTCEQRIKGYYEGRMEDIGTQLEALRGIDSEVSQDEAEQTLDEMVLSVEVIRSLKITLGTGGPGDWFEARLEDDGSIGRIDYHFNDWFDHAEMNVSDDDAARTFCERFAELAADA